MMYDEEPITDDLEQELEDHEDFVDPDDLFAEL